ncbi:MAG: methyltransferase [Thermodesulfobacteriota bacterium]
MPAQRHPAPALEAPYDELLDWARAAYGVRFDPLCIDDVRLEVLQIADMEAHVEHLAAAATGSGVELPLWSRVWPASLLTSHFLRRLPPLPGRPVLEIGAGVGVCGLFAAAFGHETLITDVNLDALRFARINALHNGLGDRATVARANFAGDVLPRRFTRIVGSEILYLEPLFAPLLAFLKTHLAAQPDAEAILSCNYVRDHQSFLGLAARDFAVSTATIGCKSCDADDAPQPQRHLINIHRLKVRHA